MAGKGEGEGARRADADTDAEAEAEADVNANDILSNALSIASNTDDVEEFSSIETEEGSFIIDQSFAIKYLKHIRV